MYKHERPRSRAGFSLMEVIVAVSILSILAGALALRAGGMIDKGKATKVVNMVGTFKTACAAYHADVGSYAHEYSGYKANHRHLSGTQKKAGWSGPYVESPRTHGQNPFGGQMHLYDRVTAGSRIEGFDVDGDENLDVTGSANMLWLSKVPPDSAKQIDSTLDRGLPEKWQNTGRVRYSDEKQHLFILVYY